MEVIGEMKDMHGKDIKLILSTSSNPAAWLSCAGGTTPLLTVGQAIELSKLLKKFVNEFK